MRLKHCSVVFALVSIAGCGHVTPQEAETAFGAALDKAFVDNAEVHGAFLAITSGPLELDGQWTKGVADENNRALTVDTPFLSASIGKTVVAAATMALVSANKLQLTDAVSKWLTGPEFACLLPEGGKQSFDDITVDMLLTHRSGLADYFEDKANDGAANVLALIADEPQRVWSTDALLAYTCAHFSPVSAPGTGFHYSDTNYDLLGLVLEAASGQPLAQVVREKVFTPLAMTHTWYHALEPAPAGTKAPAGVYIADTNVIAHPSLSADLAGGGLLTTLSDLTALVRGLAAGKPVALSTLDTQVSPDALNAGIDYGRGTFHIRPAGVFPALVGLPDMIGHSGATGSFAYYVPEHDATIVGTFNQTEWAERHIEFLLSEILPVLGRVEIPREQPQSAILAPG